MKKKDKVKVDHIAMVQALGCKLLPHVNEQYLVELQNLEAKGMLSLTPITIFQLYHLRLRRKYGNAIKVA